MTILFWLCVTAVFYIYAGYPLVMAIAAFLRRRDVKKGRHLPRVSILIAAFNEEDHIGATIENKLALDYPSDRMEIIIVSDGSTDDTDEIVSRYAAHGVRLLRQEPRAGKTSALNQALPQANGEVVVFSDANSMYAAGALKSLMSNFKDDTIGYATGKMIYVHPDGSLVGDGCSAYMKYENLLRAMETRCGSIVGVDGGIDAVRKYLYKPMKADQLPDFVLPLRVVEQGYRVVYEPDAILKEASLKSASDEYRMRVRVALRAMWALFDMRHLLSVKRFGLFAFQLWSHKVLRYLCFIFLLGAFGTNCFIVDQGPLYGLLLAMQTIAVACALVFPFCKTHRRVTPVLRILHYFMLLNLACAHAFVKFVMGKKQVLWAPRKG